jgi:ABC-type branched-subunit amino acid transport system substrate-binding protein
MQKLFALKLIVSCALLAGATASFGQETIKITNMVELPGGGDTAGTNFKNGVELAVKEINAAAIEKVGKLDRKAVAAALHGLKVATTKKPGVLMDVSFDNNGDIDRESFMVEVKNGKQVVVATLPALGAVAAPAKT